jgi:hypothetical protein
MELSGQRHAAASLPRSFHWLEDFLGPKVGMTLSEIEPWLSCFTDWAIPAHSQVTNKLTPWSTAREANSRSAGQENPAFYGTLIFITVFTRARHQSLSWVRWIQSTHSNHISQRSILVLSSHLRLVLLRCLFPSGFQIKFLCACFEFFLKFSEKNVIKIELLILVLIDTYGGRWWRSAPRQLRMNKPYLYPSQFLIIWSTKVKVKLSRYTPWRRMGGEEV